METYLYRAHVLGSEASADGTVHLDCWIQRKLYDQEIDHPWENVPNGHRTVVLRAAELLPIFSSSMTLAEQRQAVIALVKREVVRWGIEEADRAEQGLMALIPAESWPVAVPLGL